MTYPDYLVHFNKNHSKTNGQFVSGDGDGDGVVNDHANQKKGPWSAKIDNYHKGTIFKDPYYIDKQGKKRSYMSYKEMPVEAQEAERARAKGKQVVKKVAGTALSAIGVASLAVGAGFVIKKLNEKGHRTLSTDELRALGLNVVEPDFIELNRINFPKF